MGPHPSPSGSAHECTATPRISLLWTTSLACDIVAQTNHMCPIYMDQEEGNGVPDTLHTDKHTHMRVRVLADHRDVGLLRNTGIDPLPPPLPDNSKSCPTLHSSVRQRNTWFLPLEATIWIRVCNYFNLTVCKWMLAFLK